MSRHIQCQLNVIHAQYFRNLCLQSNRAERKSQEMWSQRRRYKVDLFALLAECDANYLRLCKILIRSDDGALIDRELSVDGIYGRVRFSVSEMNRYTDVITIEQALPSEVADLCIRVRVYHDVRSAEVINYQHQHRFEPRYDYPNAKMRMPDEKLQLNKLLSDFLSLCLKKGRSTGELFDQAGVLITN